ncbi:type II secretion system F family protein [Chitinasiproducens palmae]|uniref:General secretion pathway protein F n=1 Tax=Chitinasiproducens palmae TaxID=1770053 RepID=A0A1H2PRS4_9BURK|nr:type II secretion system F family protein [Chitinasiproducens palmae]SDV49571.1 type IV pilus assembly protein PilC [Chitinasiproducens palmae]
MKLAFDPKHAAANTGSVAPALDRRRCSFSPPESPAHRSPRRSLGAARLGAFCEQLAGLLDAGLSLAPSLELIAQSDEWPATAALAARLHRRLVAGRAFGSALGDETGVMPPALARILAVGEQSGRLADALRQVAGAQRHSAERSARLRSALVYPLGVLVVAAFVAVGLLIGIVPGFAELFASMGGALPPLTRVALSASRFCIEHGVQTLAVLLLGLLLAVTLYRYSPRCRHVVRGLLSRLPVVGPIRRELALAHWAGTLGRLLAARVPLLEATTLLHALTGEPALDAFSAGLSTRLKAGVTFERAVAACPTLPPRLTGLIALACQSAMLDTVLADFAVRTEKRTQQRLDTLLRLVEPAMMALLGLIVGGIVFALYLPIIQAGQML